MIQYIDPDGQPRETDSIDNIPDGSQIQLEVVIVSKQLRPGDIKYKGKVVRKTVPTFASGDCHILLEDGPFAYQSVSLDEWVEIERHPIRINIPHYTYGSPPSLREIEVPNYTWNDPYMCLRCGKGCMLPDSFCKQCSDLVNPPVIPLP